MTGSGAPGKGGLAWFVARRLAASPGRAQLSLVSTVSTWGLALGVASLVVIFSITSGFEDVFREKILGVYPHLVVIGRGGDLPDWEEVLARLEGKPHLSSASPATYDEMMASHGSRRSGAIVKGIDVRDPGMAATLRPFLLDVEPAALLPAGGLEWLGDELVVAPLPGGASRTIVVAGEGPPLVVEDFAEQEEIGRARFLAVAPEPVAVELEGLLFDQSFMLSGGRPSRYHELSAAGPARLAVAGVELPLELREGNHNVVLSRAGEGWRLHVCPAYRPEAADQAARLCVVNLLDRPLLVRLPSANHRLEAGEAAQLEEAQVVRPRLFLGEELARRIEAAPGDIIRLVSPLYSVPGSALGRRGGRTIAESFEVAGLIRLGFFEYDSKLAIVDFDAARRFLHQGDVARWVEVRVDDLFASEQRAVELQRALADFSLLDLAAGYGPLQEKFLAAASLLPEPVDAADLVANSNRLLGSVKFSNLRGELALGFKDEYRVITWEEMNKPLFTSMRRQRIVLSLFFLIIIVVAAFNIVSSQVMLVREKGPAIAILKAMGASSGLISRVFLLQGMAIGLAGTAGGLLFALALCFGLEQIGFPLDAKVYFVDHLPVALHWWDLALAGTASLVAIFLAVLFAARKAAARSPVEGLRELE